MGKLRGFLEHERQEAPKRPVAERVRDFSELELSAAEETVRTEGARCMDCGIPFCNTGCPLGNLIPDWNDAAHRGQWRMAGERLHATNNFPEITGRICPAPCEAACVLGINADAVSIRLIERSVADRALAEGAGEPRPAVRRTGRHVAIVGAGPAGLAAAQELTRAGHDVTVLERDLRPGGLLTYGIPDFKLDKSIVERRVRQLEGEGVRFRTGVHVGRDVDADDLRQDFDAVVLAVGARVPRNLPVPGRELEGIDFAMDFLCQQNRRLAGEPLVGPEIVAAGKRVVVIGGGDTGSDCIGTAHRQGAASVLNLELLPQPPAERDCSTPWPLWPLMLRTSSSHEEGGDRRFRVATEAFGGSGRVERLHCVEVEQQGGRLQRIPGTEFSIEADLVLLALGFSHAEHGGVLQQFGIALDGRGNIVVDAELATNVPGIFAAGDAQRGQSLVVWAIADGRRAARSVDRYLMGRTDLPAPPSAGHMLRQS